MQHWDRGISGRLQRVSTPIEHGCEVSVHSDQMDPLPKEQQSQQGTPVNPTAYRSMRDHIHPPRVSAPSCIIPPAEEVAVRPYLVPLLPTFYGMENENPYSHIRDFEEVCTTFKEGITDMDLLKLKAFPLTLKDKAKIWLNSLRPRTIRNWADLQAEFLKKFFNATKTNSLKRQIYTYSAYDNEKFYQCWERFIEPINACPHHGFDTWMPVNHFYNGMSPAMKQLLETMCGGDFLSKHPEEAMDFLSYVAETSKGWDEPNPRDVEKMRQPAHPKGGIYALSEDMEMKAKISTLTSKVEELEGKRLHEVQAVTENPAQANPGTNFQTTAHPEEHYPMASSVKDLMSEYANAVGQFKEGTPVNPTAYRSMRDHIHPPRVSAPSCIIPPAKEVAVRPYLVPLLPTFYGMENENPYSHIRDFEEVCTTFKEGITDMDLLKLKAFPLTLKDKAKIWLNSLRPRTIRNWADLQAEFLKKFFNATKTNSLKRQIYTYSAYDNEKFYQCWERFIEPINACPHHGFDTWMPVNHFYNGMSPAMKQLLETMCGGDFLSKHPEEAMDFLSYVAETSKGWDEPNPRDVEKMRQPAHPKGGIYALSEDMEMKAKISTLTSKVEELEGKRLHKVQAVTENPAQANPGTNFQTTAHPEEHYPMASSVKDLMSEYANAVGQFKPQPNAQYGNT